MSSTTHYALEQMPTGASDWVSLWNSSINKIEVGRTVKLTAGETITNYEGFYVSTSNGKAYITDAGEFPVGIWQSASTSTDVEGFGQIEGVMTNGSWSWNTGVLLYLDGSGALTETKQGHRAVAYSISATEIMLIPPTKPIGVIKLDTTSAGNVGAGEDTLITYDLPANTLNSDGRTVKIKAWGTTASNSNTKTIKLYFGSTVIITDSLAIVGDSWLFEGVVTRTGASAQDAIGEGKINGITPTVTHSEPSEDNTTATTIKITGEATSNDDIVAQGLLVEVIN